MSEPALFMQPNNAPRAPLSASERLAAEPNLGRTLKISLIAHLVFALFIVVKSLIFPGKPMHFIPALRVDIVGLPDILKKDKATVSNAAELNKALRDAEVKAKELKEAAKEAKKKAAKPKEIAKPDEMVLKPKSAAEEKTDKDRSKKLKSALDRIKALNKIAEDEAPSPVVVKGNQVSKGTSLSGNAREAAEASYFDVLQSRLQENWALPVWLARQDLGATVQIYIDGRGRLRNFKFIKVSGNNQFDDAIRKTLSDSQPFPIPPRELSEMLMIDGITVGFPL